jgi:hypothetical protein
MPNTGKAAIYANGLYACHDTTLQEHVGHTANQEYRRMHCSSAYMNQNCKSRYIYYCVTTGSSFPHKTYVSPFVSLEQFFIFIWNRMDTTANIGTIQ